MPQNFAQHLSWKTWSTIRHTGRLIERKHRATVIRATRNIARQRPEIQRLHGERLGGALVFFRHDEERSYAMARLKADRFQRYRSKDPRLHWNKDEGALRRELDDQSRRELIGQGGAWLRQVEIFLAQKHARTRDACVVRSILSLQPAVRTFRASPAREGRNLPSGLAASGLPPGRRPKPEDGDRSAAAPAATRSHA
jgi:hypothetical protein